MEWVGGGSGRSRGNCSQPSTYIDPRPIIIFPVIIIIKNNYRFFFLQTKRYRDDGYEWKTRKTTKTVREDRMKLKVGGYQVCDVK